MSTSAHFNFYECLLDNLYIILESNCLSSILDLECKYVDLLVSNIIPREGCLRLKEAVSQD